MNNKIINNSKNIFYLKAHNVPLFVFLNGLYVSYFIILYNIVSEMFFSLDFFMFILFI